MNDLHFRFAEDTDLATLVRLRDDAARWMLAQGITGQWQPGQLAEFIRELIVLGTNKSLDAARTRAPDSAARQ